MSEIQISRQHQLGKERCQELVKELANKLEQRLGGSCQFDGDVVYYNHMGARGKLVASADRVDVTVKLGLMAMAFKPKIEKFINQACDDYID